MNRDPIIIIGAGPSGLMAAEYLAKNGHEVHIYEQNKAAARKFLVAGNGGFNLTHSEPIEQFVHRYDKEQIHHIIHNFDNNETIKWLHSLGIQTYIGSSGKIFPTKNIKPIQVLKAWLDRLTSLNVKIHYEHTFVDFNKTKVKFAHKNDLLEIKYAVLLLALGGGSWQKTGSNAKWIEILRNKNININPLQPANSGYNTSQNLQQLEGKILKNIEIRFNNIRKKGELVFTNYGIEGSPVYYLNRFTRDSLFPLTLNIDLKPTLSEQKIQAELSKDKNTSKILKDKLKLNSTAIELLKNLSKNEYTNPILLSSIIKNYPIEVKSYRPIDEVISTAGGILFDELNSSLNLKKYPNIYCLGEMLDWEAPTGGYLLQGCFSMGVFVARQINETYMDYKK